MMRRPLVLLGSLLLCSSLVACQPGGDTTPSPTPSVSSSASTQSQTPSATPTPSATTPSEDELFAEAERVFRAAMELQARYVEGGYGEVPVELADYYAPEYFEFARAAYEQMRDQGWMVEGRPVITSAPARGVTKDDSEVALRTCVDAREVVITDSGGGGVGRGNLSVGVHYFRTVDGLLKISGADIQEADSCPLS